MNYEGQFFIPSAVTKWRVSGTSKKLFGKVNNKLVNARRSNMIRRQVIIIPTNFTINIILCLLKYENSYDRII